MLNTERAIDFNELPSPVLTAYLRVSRDDASRNAPIPGYMTWLKNNAASLATGVSPNEVEMYLKEVHRVEEFLHDRVPHEKSLVIFAGPGVWETLPMQVEVENELHWGKPAISQRQWLIAEHKRYLIFAVDRGRARFFEYQLGEISQLEEMKFEVDISQWKEKDMGHVARPGIHESYGSQREVFNHRMDAQYNVILKKASHRAVQLFHRGGFGAIFVVGSLRLTDPVVAEFPAELRNCCRVVKKDLGKFGLFQIGARLQPEIQKWERKHEMETVNGLIEAERGVARGIEESLSHLQKGRVRSLVIARDLDVRLHLCKSCGWVDFSADPVCPQCSGKRTDVSLREVLPDLTARFGIQMEVLSGDAAEKLKSEGGMLAWLGQGRSER